ncbi:hypothetical protein M422DRAFT_48014 [Sphaerobolus stellatus SS14]|uniref:Uncharacterized protein n=1 Tax=Sphaerobolus stellatus (strain SS14) TaxID=990650 RepID=A0A0C9UIV4_SPHS4|nr:hypothetical protein M422DRAFT_48014 [Sphaerobolus stellatus SS14]
MVNQKNQKSQRKCKVDGNQELSETAISQGIIPEQIPKKRTSRHNHKKNTMKAVKTTAVIVDDDVLDDVAEVAALNDEVPKLATAVNKQQKKKGTVFNQLTADKEEFVQQDSTFVFMDDGEIEEVNMKKAGHPKKVDPEIYKLHIMVPVGIDDDGVKQHISIQLTASFNEVVNEIYISIGFEMRILCTSNKLLTGRLKEDYLNTVKACKSETVVVVDVLVDANYLTAFCHTLKVKVKNSRNGSKKSVKVTAKLRNLNAGTDDSDGNEGDSNTGGDGLMSTEQCDAMDLLKFILGPLMAIVAYQKDPSGEEVIEKKPPHFGKFLQFHMEKVADVTLKSPSPEPVNNPAGLAALGIPAHGGAFLFSFFFPHLLTAAASGYPLPTTNGAFPHPSQQPILPGLNVAPNGPVVNLPQSGASHPLSSDSFNSNPIPFPSITKLFNGLKDKPIAA